VGKDAKESGLDLFEDMPDILGETEKSHERCQDCRIRRRNSSNHCTAISDDMVR
jgi:hypothetical protein